MFGEYVRDRRLERNLTLREFCRMIDEDPSNWSKVERGILPPPQSIEKLNSIARVLRLKKGGEDYLELLDGAAISRGKIPKDLLSDKSVIGLLPAFLRTIGSVKPTKEEIMKLINRLKEEG